MNSSMIATPSHSCPMCMETAELFAVANGRNYFNCHNCHGIFMDSRARLSIDAEKERYQEHNNDVYDRSYRAFVAPITQYVMNRYTPASRGLDFGAGTGPVISKVLHENGFTIKPYDPIFIADPDALQGAYDYIVCCETMEHFFNPLKEFGLLFQLLMRGGALICMTELFTDGCNFTAWYYKNDPTHVFFYSAETIAWLREKLRFTDVSIVKRMIVFTK